MRKQYGLFLGILVYASSTVAADDKQVYEVDKVLSNGYYIINGVTFKPHSACKMLQKNDKVKFIHGSPNGDCVSAKIADLRSNSTCLLFCDEEETNE